MHSQAISLSPTTNLQSPQDVLNDMPKSLEKNSITIDEKIENKVAAPVEEPQFYYLKMEDAEFSDFRKTLPEKFQKISKAEAEQLLEKNKGQFKAEYVLDFAADATNGLFPVWLVKTGSSGFILCASLLSGVPQETLQQDMVLGKISTAIVWITSLLATAQWIFMYSPWTEATKATLQKATQEATSLLDEIKKTLAEAWQHPSENAIKLLGFLAFQCLTKLININASSTEIFFTPAGLTWIPTILILFLATRYCSQVWDKSVHEGFDFWINSKEHTSVLEQIKKGNFAIAFKILFEGLSSTILKGMQYYFIAEGNQKLFGSWVHPVVMLVLGIVHGLLVNYPTAFKNAMGPLETLDRLLKEKLDEKIDLFIDEQIKILSTLDEEKKAKYFKGLVQNIKTDLIAIDINSPEYKSLQTPELDNKLENLIKPLAQLTADNKAGKMELKKQIMQFNSDFIETKIIKDGRLKLLFHEPLNAFTVILNTLFGGYAGYKLFSPSLSTIMSPKASIPLVTTLGATLIGGFYYRAVTNTEVKKEVGEALNPDLRKNEAEKPGGKLKLSSFVLAASGAFSSGLSAIGSAGSSVKDSTAGIAAVVFASTQKMINDTRYSEPYIYSTLKTQAAGIASYFKSDPKPDAKQVAVSENKTPADPKAIQVETQTNVSGARFWNVSPKSALAFAGDKTLQLANSINMDRIRFWNADKKPSSSPKEMNYVERNKFEI